MEEIRQIAKLPTVEIMNETVQIDLSDYWNHFLNIEYEVDGVNMTVTDNILMI